MTLTQSTLLKALSFAIPGFAIFWLGLYLMISNLFVGFPTMLGGLLLMIFAYWAFVDPLELLQQTVREMSWDGQANPFPEEHAEIVYLALEDDDKLSARQIFKVIKLMDQYLPHDAMYPQPEIEPIDYVEELNQKFEKVKS